MKLRFIEKVGKLAKFVIPLQDAHEGRRCNSLSMARVEAVLARIKAWICQHLHFDQNLGLWSQMNHNMEILEREKNHHARLECEAR